VGLVLARSLIDRETVFSGKEVKIKNGDTADEVKLLG
jgi:hypothetical protein